MTFGATTAPRIANAADAAGLARVHVTSWHETYTGLVPDELLSTLSIEHRTTVWKRMLDDPSSFNGLRIFVSECRGEIVGFGSCGKQRAAILAAIGLDAEVEAIYVLRSSQGRGVGRALVRTMAADLFRRGHRGMSLWVLRENAKARRFYERLGGVVVAEKEERRAGGVLVEVAYGWRGLGPLMA
jgi:ribosomal protein S18 acetylase RimI-like enzyme